MDNTICIIDAATLNSRIHELKQWVYDGYLRILIPLGAQDRIEELKKAAAAKKEPQKKSHVRQISSRAIRKEQPLFDINPKTTLELLSRAKSGEGIDGVSFQKSGEEFTPWKNNARESNGSNEAPDASASFADALLRKLNLDNPSEPKESGELNSQAASHPTEKTPSTAPRQLPIIPSTGVSEKLKPILSCALWHMHESELDSPNPKRTFILSDNREVMTAAKMLQIPFISFHDVRELRARVIEAQDQRDIKGQLEEDFKVPTTGQSNGQVDSSLMSLPSPLQTEIPALPSSPSRALQPPLLATTNITEPKSPSFFLRDPILSPTLGQSPNQGKASFLAPIGTGRPKVAAKAKGRGDETDTISPSSLLLGSVADEPEAAGLSPLAAFDGSPQLLNGTLPKAAEPESDSDEEVIVFNPRARRASSRVKTMAESSTSRLSTAANGLRTSQTFPSRPSTSGGFPEHDSTQSNMFTVNDSIWLDPPLMPYDEADKPERSPVLSSLKPQSPIFTPGQPYLANTLAVPHKPSRSIEDVMGDTSSKGSTSPAQSPRTQAKSPASRTHRAPPIRRNASFDQQQRQQSEMIIKLQREAIQRQSKNPPSKPAAKPPPRQVQIEPTENPTIIDPDAFDRSYVVQKPTGHAAPSNPGKKQSSRRRSPKASPKRHAKSKTEGDVDYVLKSGTPRGSTRGRGKLWVP